MDSIPYILYFGSDFFIEYPSKKSAICVADSIASALLKVSIMGALNDMQCEAGETPVFENKYTIPDYFINLVLRKYNMHISPK